MMPRAMGMIERSANLERDFYRSGSSERLITVHHTLKPLGVPA